MSRKKRVEERNNIDLDNVEAVELTGEQAEHVQLRAKTISRVLTFVGFNWTEIKVLFGIVKKKCDHWERLRKESADNNRGGCKFCIFWIPEENKCHLKDDWIPRFQKEVLSKGKEI